jgi:DNA-directed RNA polymerase specialized sigma24 family protein
MGFDLHRTVTAVIEALPGPYRQLLALSELKGLNADQIAQALGIAPPQVRVGLLYARRAMCQRLSQQMHAAGR